MLGRLTNTSFTNFAFNVQNVVDYLASRGIIAILGTRFTTEELRQQRWTLRPTTRRSPVAPTRVLSRTLLDGSVSMEFQGYTPIPETTTRGSNAIIEEQDDREVTSPDDEILAVVTEEFQEAFFVKKLDQNALLPERKTAGAARYDLSPTHTYIIETGERELISTGLAITILEGYYGRIAPRSGVAWQKGIQIGAGVIDNDFRGEEIAQLILEKIATLEVIQVVELPPTVRGAGSFGSTSEQNMNLTSEQNMNLTDQRRVAPNPVDTMQVQLGTLEWENLMNKLMPLQSTPSTPSTSQQQLHILTTEEPEEWINPFYTEGGGYDSSNPSFYYAKSDDNAQMIAHIDLEEGLELDYPVQKQSEDYYWGIEAVIAPPPPTPYDKKNLIPELLSYIDYLLAENRRLQVEINRLTKRYSDKEGELTQELFEDLQQLSLEKGKEQGIFLEEHSVLKAAEGRDQASVVVVGDDPEERATTMAVRALIKNRGGTVTAGQRQKSNVAGARGDPVPPCGRRKGRRLRDQTSVVVVGDDPGERATTMAARALIKNRGGTMTTGQRRKSNVAGARNDPLLPCDWALVRQIKAQVQKLPDLEIPPETTYIILEIDGSMTGWGGACKWRPRKNDPQAVEKACAYAHGTRVKVNFEHIDGRLNVFPSNLSRLVEDSETLAVLTEERIGGSAQFSLLTEYEDLIHETAKNILLLEEHQKRQRMKDIENQAIRNASLVINELELIQQMKERLHHKPEAMVFDLRKLLPFAFGGSDSNSADKPGSGDFHGPQVAADGLDQALLQRHSGRGRDQVRLPSMTPLQGR
ncbi:hypothetical protein ZIOFF_069731 [Zingiber officinale]|uniref:dUTP diphosphatase n=1 Tax=Zingiber officinale TaxID=94328 RepID=A0A8J5CW46_ZINOF|nr:hypothetical protein ZIOFF_069731 [Zingiber officinale]